MRALLDARGALCDQVSAVACASSSEPSLDEVRVHSDRFGLPVSAGRARFIAASPAFQDSLRAAYAPGYADDAPVVVLDEGPLSGAALAVEVEPGASRSAA
jgi:hypothetical protein